jgi:hypothetical protein
VLLWLEGQVVHFFRVTFEIEKLHVVVFSGLPPASAGC